MRLAIKLHKKFLSVISVLLMVMLLPISGTVSAATVGTNAYVPSGPGTSCPNSYYLTENEVEEMYHSKSNYESAAGWASLIFGGASYFVASGALAVSSGLLGGASLGSSSTANWINEAYYKDTGVLFCHEGLEKDTSTVINDAYYENPHRYYY
ncbi:hypothetical protein [Salimicrobium humidisoli]|nr:hypothetical protein [Salimicrobium humidisoli]